MDSIVRAQAVFNGRGNEERGILKYLILGAGPAGLTIANKLRQAKKTDFLLLEKEVGGLCRSLNVDGAHFDIRHPDVVDFSLHLCQKSNG